MSTKMPPAATASKMAAAMPGWSETPLMVSRACDSSSDDVVDRQLFHLLQPGDDGHRVAGAADRRGTLFLGGHRLRCALSSSNAWCTARSAAAAWSRATSTEILISLVVIIWMLTPGSARARNIRSATPVCRAMPSPTTETLATSSS